MANGIKWEINDKEGSKDSHVNPEFDIDYKKDWKHFVSTIANKEKLDKIAIEDIKKFYYCFGHELGARVRFPENSDEGSFVYDVGTYVYNIPSKEKVVEVYEYIKNKDEKGIVGSVFAGYDKKYKYTLEINAPNLILSSSKLERAKVPHKRVKGEYDYKDAVKYFGYAFSEIIATLGNSEKTWHLCDKLDKDFKSTMRTYKVYVIPVISQADLVYKIKKIPSDKFNDYVSTIKEKSRKYMLENRVNIINNDTVEVIFTIRQQ